MTYSRPAHTDDMAAALGRAGNDPVLDEFAPAVHRLRVPGETVREMAVMRQSSGPVGVIVTDRRIFIDARRDGGEVHTLPVHAVTGVEAETAGDGLTILRLWCLGAPVDLPGLSTRGLHRIRWAIRFVDVVEPQQPLDVIDRFEAWSRVLADSSMSDDERAAATNQILTF